MSSKACIATVIIALATASSPSPETYVSQAPALSSLEAPVNDRAIGDSPGFVFHEASEAEAEEMLWAIGRFRDSGLELPSLDIYFADGCQQRFGAFGRFQRSSVAPPWRVEVCTTGVYLHELAHAWDRWTLTDADRLVFLDLRGLDAWHGIDIPWAERGEEELARLIARVLGQGVNNFPNDEQLIDYDHFERITGISAPIVRVADSMSSRSGAPPY